MGSFQLNKLRCDIDRMLWEPPKGATEAMLRSFERHGPLSVKGFEELAKKMNLPMTEFDEQKYAFKSVGGKSGQYDLRFRNFWAGINRQVTNEYCLESHYGFGNEKTI